MCRLNVHVFSLYLRVIFQPNFQHIQERLKCFVPTANILDNYQTIISMCLKMGVLFHSHYYIWSSWSALKLLYFVLSWFTVWRILCPVNCGAWEVIALWEGCVQTFANILFANSSCFIYKFIQCTLRLTPFLSSLFCDFVWLPTVNWDSNSSGHFTSIGILENSHWPNNLNQFSAWTRYSGWNVKKCEDTVCVGLCN